MTGVILVLAVIVVVLIEWLERVSPERRELSQELR
jgi:hypothetical protein